MSQEAPEGEVRPLFHVNEADMAEAFTLWDTRYREDPTKFWDDVTHLLGHTPESYGEAAAAYFGSLLREIGL